MPGSNNGTGHPLTFRCAKCKTQRNWRRDSFRGTNCVATGLTKPARKGGIRMNTRVIQYECLDCGHIGWTQHEQGERLYRQQQDRAAQKILTTGSTQIGGKGVKRNL